jgi:processive 1,2-diacylglycerol beta-glucosyltransferase
MKKIAVLSVSAGAGHIRAAEAIRETAHQEFKDVEVVHIDVMDYVPKLFKKSYAESYVKLVQKHPMAWAYLYNKSDEIEGRKSVSILKKIRQMIESMNTIKLRKAIRKLEVDHIICTHFLPAELISRMIDKGHDMPPCWVQITDYDVHNFWKQKHMAGYFVGSEEIAAKVIGENIDNNNVYVTGISIMPQFKKKFSRIECAEELGVRPDKKTLLMMAGGFGIGAIDEAAEKLIENDDELQIIALAGRSEKLLERLNKVSSRYPNQLLPMGFTTEIEKLMAVSDIAVTKPGGLTTSECLATGLPMIVINPIPGQEERNCDYLLENGAGMKALDFIGLKFKVNSLVNNPAKLKEMNENAVKIGKPNAARDLLSIVLAG